MILKKYKMIATKNFFLTLKTEAIKNNIANGAAALAFYLLLSIFPAMIFLLSLLPFLPFENLDQSILVFMSQFLPEQIVMLFSRVISEMTSVPEKKWLSFGFFASIWAASSGMSGIIRQLNRIYKIKKARQVWKNQIVAVLMTLVLAFSTALALCMIVLGGQLQRALASLLGFQDSIPIFLDTLRIGIAVLFLLIGFSFIYCYAPNLKQKFKIVTPGSIVAVTLLGIATFGFHYYIDNFANFSAMYGSLGAVIALMLCLYIVGFALLLGAEVNVIIDNSLVDRERNR